MKDYKIGIINIKCPYCGKTGIILHEISEAVSDNLYYAKCECAYITSLQTKPESVCEEIKEKLNKKKNCLNIIEKINKSTIKNKRDYQKRKWKSLYKYACDEN